MFSDALIRHCFAFNFASFIVCVPYLKSCYTEIIALSLFTPFVQRAAEMF